MTVPSPATGPDFAGVLSSFGGFLRCEVCGRKRPLDADDSGYYVRSRWPKHCGYTMRWWTQRQVDAGEVPALAAQPHRDHLDFDPSWLT